MGSRASYIVKRGGAVHVFGSHWGASSLTDDLFWGPDHATAVFESQTKLDELEDIFGGEEGVACIDWETRTLLWYASNCELPLQQRLYQRMLAVTWPGWTVRMAVRGVNEILEHLGTSVDELLDEDFTGDEDPEDEIDDPDDDEDVQDELILEEDSVFEPQPVDKPVTSFEELELGNWLTIRRPDGTYRDYFGFRGELEDCLAHGERVIEELQKYPALRTPPPELVTLGGAIVDQQQRILWRWEGPRYKWLEKEIQTAWPSDWSYQDIPGQWRGQLQATAREADGLAGDERQLLGATVSELLIDASGNPLAAMSTIALIGRATRYLMLGGTLAVGILGGGLAYWLESTVFGIVVALLFLFCAIITIQYWRRSALMLGVMDMVQANHADSPRPAGLGIEERRKTLNQVLGALGYPSVEELEAAGEVRSPMDDWEDEDEDEDDDEA